MTEQDGYMWTAHRDDDGKLVIDWRMPLKEARERAREEAARTEERFRSAPFPLYGLPPGWDGSRYLGGGSWGGPAGKERTKSLSIVHGALVHGDGPMLVVETASEFSIDGGDLLSIAGLIWEGRSASVADAIAELGRHGRDARSLPRPEPTTFVFDVDGAATPFDGFTNGEDWVARGKIGSLYLTLAALPFNARDVALLRVVDIEPYILGTRSFHQQDM